MAYIPGSGGTFGKFLLEQMAQGVLAGIAEQTEMDGEAKESTGQ